MAKVLLKYKNYDVHSITTTHGGTTNANIATWVMASSLGMKEVVVAIDVKSLTWELVEASLVFNLNLLSQSQRSLISRFGRKSGRTFRKLTPRIPHVMDDRGVPYLTGSIGFAQIAVRDWLEGEDHMLVRGRVVSQQVLNHDGVVMTNDWLRAQGLVRG